MNRPRLTDTSPDAEAVQLELVRRMPPQQRVAQAVRLSREVRDLARSAILRRFPGIEELDVRIRLVELQYGPELAAGFEEGLRQRKVAMDDDLLNPALEPIALWLSLRRIPWFVGGSVASSWHGARRSTVDVDIVVDLAAADAEPLVSAMQADYYVSSFAAIEAVSRRTCFNLVHYATSCKVDLFVSRNRPFDRSALARTARGSLVKNGTEYPISSLEDILLAKLEWFRLGNEVSERQWDDLLQLVKLAGAELDQSYLERFSRDLSVSDLLDRLLLQSRDPDQELKGG